MSRIDEKIKKKIIEHLFWDNRVNAANVKVVVKNSVVTLSGTVDSIKARIASEDDAWSIEGVSQVNNVLRVGYRSKDQLRSDAQIKTQVEKAVFWNSDMADAEVDVEISKGDVLLKGVVDSYWKKEEAEEIVSRIFGVRSVDNHLTIVPTNDYQDIEIAEDIRRAVDRNLMLKADQVQIKVEDGIVSLSGQVASQFARRQAREIAAHTAGVRDVKDELKLVVPVVLEG
jgi:osmotically-inducible protein OsmY